jgi:hypothetical protein
VILQSVGIVFFGGNRKSPGRFAINPKRPGPGMKKADRISRKNFLENCLLFSIFYCLRGRGSAEIGEKYF